MINKIYHLEIEEDSTEEYWIGVHTHLEGHQLAYFINQNSPAILKRTKKDLQNEKQEGVFLHFKWEDILTETSCQLISNKFIQEKYKERINKNTFFELPQRNEVSLISEFKQVDFFIKSTDMAMLKNIQNQLANWSMITLTYSISLEKIRSQMNLIFD